MAASPENKTHTRHKFKDFIFSTKNEKNGYLRVLLIVQRLGIWVLFANKRVNQQQEQHVEQQCTHNRQVNDDGYLRHKTLEILILLLHKLTESQFSDFVIHHVPVEANLNSLEQRYHKTVFCF